MGLPAPSASQIDALTALKGVADAGVTGSAIKITAIQSALDKQQEVEDFQKSTFDTVNDEIIRRYEVERRWLDGQDIALPIVEADLTSFAAGDDTGRLWNGGAFDPLRIDEFDGAPLVALEAEHESAQFTPQDEIIDRLQNGISGQILLDVGANIQDPLDASDTSAAILEDTTAINVGDRLFVSGGGFAGVLEVTNASGGGFCTGEDNPPQGDEASCIADNGTWTDANSIDFIWLIVPSNIIPAGSDIGQKTFDGFDNTERTNKTATDAVFQDLMDTLLDDLETVFNNRIVALDNQITQLQANQDDNLDPDAETDASTSKSAVDSFLGITPPSTIDISDTGITAINNEKAVRQPQVTQRITDIATAIAFGESGVTSYYDVRFNTAEGRCRLNNGSIVLLNDLESAKSGIESGAVEAQALSDRYNALIP